MLVLYLTLIVLSLLLFGAHLFRHGWTLPLIATVALLGVLLIRRPWAARIVQLALLLATAEWSRTLLQLIDLRTQAGLPWLRLAVILGCVVILTGASALSFQTRRLGAFYGLRHHAGSAGRAP